MKKLLAILLALALLLPVFTMTGCQTPPDDGIDDGGGNVDDTPSGGDTETPDSTQLALIEDGVPNFTIVYDHTLDATVISAITLWDNRLGGFDIDVTVNAGYNVNKVQDCEILIGTTFMGRDGYIVDVRDYGDEGYVIKVVDEKVIIAGGTPQSTIAAIKLFFEDYIGYKGNATAADLQNVSIARSLTVEKHQKYPITALKVGGVNIDRSYYIRADKGAAENAAAQLLQGALYSYAGIWLDIACPDNDPGKKVVVDFVENAGEDGFSVSVDEEGNLTVLCSYSNSFSIGMTHFIDNVLKKAKGELSFPASYEYTTNVSVVKYSDFGADVTGRHDSFDAIIAAHAFANEGGQRVEADEGATYYIGHHLKEAVVKTDTDWKDACFIIDDTDVPSDSQRGYWIFHITPDKASYNIDLDEVELDLSKFKKNSTNIGLTFNEDVMLYIVNDNKKVYIRAGANSGQSSQQEIVMVDKNGNLHVDTPLIWDYDSITSIKVVPIDEEKITVQGGIFRTRANTRTSESKYYARGICLNRSNAVVYNVRHEIVSQPTTRNGSCPYLGFFYAQLAANVTFEKCVMTPHRTYWTLQPDGDDVQQGNYDTQAVRCFNITWKNCTQTIDHNTRYDSAGINLWGVMASNFCKNLTFDGCKLSRFDAHQGVHNITIKDSEVGEVINLVGSGTATLINSKLSRGQNNYFIRLREDYGSTWEGDVIIKNCTLVSSSTSVAYVIRADWINWDFGYDCYIPNVDIDGLTVVDKNGTALSSSNVYVFKNFRQYYNSNYRNFGSESDYYSGSIIADNGVNKNPLIVPATIKTKNFAFNDYVSGTNMDVILDAVTKERE